MWYWHGVRPALLKCHPAMQRNLLPVSLPSACLPFSALFLPHTKAALTWNPALCRSDTCVSLPPPGALITQGESFSAPLRRLALVNTTHSRYIAWKAGLIRDALGPSLMQPTCFLLVLLIFYVLNNTF